MFPRDIRGTLPTAYEQKKNIITVRIDNGHTPSIVLCKKSLGDWDHCQPQWSIHHWQLRSSKGAAIGRDDGTVERHHKGTAKGPNAIGRDNGELGRDVGAIEGQYDGTTEIPDDGKAVGRDDGTVEEQYDRSSLKNQ